MLSRWCAADDRQVSLLLRLPFCELSYEQTFPEEDGTPHLDGPGHWVLLRREAETAGILARRLDDCAPDEEMKIASVLGRMKRVPESAASPLSRALARGNVLAGHALLRTSCIGAECVATLEFALECPDDRVAAVAALALVRAGRQTDRTMAASVRAFCQFNSATQRLAGPSLSVAAERAMPPLLDLLANASEEDRTRALVAIAGSESDLRRLAVGVSSYLADPSEGVRIAAACAIRGADPRSVDALAVINRALASADQWTRARAEVALVLSPTDVPTFVAALRRNLGDADALVRFLAAAALLRGGTAEDVESLTRILDESAPHCEPVALAVVMTRLGPAARCLAKHLVGKVKGQAWPVSPDGLDALSAALRAAGPEACDAIVPLLEFDPFGLGVMRKLLRAMGETARPRLTRELERSERVLEALPALAELTDLDEPTAQRLHRLTEGETPDVMAWAALALWAAGGNGAVVAKTLLDTLPKVDIATRQLGMAVLLALSPSGQVASADWLRSASLLPPSQKALPIAGCLLTGGTAEQVLPEARSLFDDYITSKPEEEPWVIGIEVFGPEASPLLPLIDRTAAQVSREGARSELAECRYRISGDMGGFAEWALDGFEEMDGDMREQRAVLVAVNLADSPDAAIRTLVAKHAGTATDLATLMARNASDMGIVNLASGACRRAGTPRPVLLDLFLESCALRLREPAGSGDVLAYGAGMVMPHVRGPQREALAQVCRAAAENDRARATLENRAVTLLGDSEAEVRRTALGCLGAITLAKCPPETRLRVTRVADDDTEAEVRRAASSALHAR